MRFTGLMALSFFSYWIPQALGQNPYLINDHLQWQFENRGEYGPDEVDIDVTDAWKLTTGGQTYENNEIVVAIIDRGVLSKHPDLERNIWVNRLEIPNNNIDDDGNGFIDDINGWNFRENTNDISNGGIGHHHGTPINGIIGADGFNNFGVSGINKSIF